MLIHPKLQNYKKQFLISTIGFVFIRDNKNILLEFKGIKIRLFDGDTVFMPPWCKACTFIKKFNVTSKWSEISSKCLLDVEGSHIGKQNVL